MRILILGAKGNLGMQLVKVFRDADHDVLACDREDLDVLDFDAAAAMIRDGGFDVIINTVAWNDVDGAEDPAKRGLCRKMNVELPGVLAAASAAAGSVFVHYSSDYVFGGDGLAEYVESSEPCPLNEYGRSKADGEKSALASGERVIILRTTKLFGPTAQSAASKPGFCEIIMKAAKTKPELTVVDEEFGRPTYTLDLAEATLRLVQSDVASGTYHVVNEGPPVTWFGFAREIFDTLGITIPIRPVPSSAFPRPAVRPASSVLANTKLPPLPQRRDALDRHLKSQA